MSKKFHLTICDYRSHNSNSLPPSPPHTDFLRERIYFRAAYPQLVKTMYFYKIQGQGAREGDTKINYFRATGAVASVTADTPPLINRPLNRFNIKCNATCSKRDIEKMYPKWLGFTSTIQTGKRTAIRRTAVPETGVFRYHGYTNQGPLENPRTSQHYCIGVLKGAPNWSPITQRDASISDNECHLF